MTPLVPPPDHPGCREFASAVQQLLDREIASGDLCRSHALECADCRALLAAAETLSAGLVQLNGPSPAPGLRDRIAAAAVRDHRRRRIARWGGVGVAVAAVLLVAVGLLLNSRPGVQDRDFVKSEPPANAPEPAAPGRVSDRFVEAGSALASLTRKASDQALTPTRTLVPSADKVSFAPADLPPGVEPAAESLADMPDAAKAGLEPVTSGARRAVNLFLRDTGLSRPKS